MSEGNFQVNLKGMIEILGDNLYSSPAVFIREVLQNCVDAITARQISGESFKPEINLEIIPGETPTLVVDDNGIGLTEEECHEFLATIGGSSKRISERTEDFIGRFGIGLLSCFMVADRIHLTTQSAKTDYSIEWIGNSDGTYTLTKQPEKENCGTVLYLRSAQDRQNFFDLDFILGKSRHYASFLSYEITVVDESGEHAVNQQVPWEIADCSDTYKLQWAQDFFGQKFLDIVSVVSQPGLKVIACILPHSSSVHTRQKHRVYLKGMLLTEKGDGLIPDWAFFARFIVLSDSLTPTASREEIKEDTNLERVAGRISFALLEYMTNLELDDPAMFKKLIALHEMSLKSLATEDDRCFEIFMEHFNFETSMGYLKFKEIRQETKKLFIVRSMDQFRKFASIAASQNVCIVNCVYVHAEELMKRAIKFYPELEIAEFESTHLIDSFTELSLAEKDDVFGFIRTCEQILEPWKVDVEIKYFDPSTIPALLMENDEAQLLRSLEKTQEFAEDDFLSSFLNDVSEPVKSQSRRRLCFNYSSEIIKMLIPENDEEIKTSIELLYFQSLLLGQFNLTAAEMKHMTKTTTGLISQAVKGRGNL